jgi:L-ribulose-5-phosphate 3-epimerase
MRLSTQTDLLARVFGDEECLRILARSGYDAADLSFFEMTGGKGVWCGSDWRAHAERLKEVAHSLGIVFNQAHAPFPSNRGEEPYDTVIFERIVRAMEAAALLGARSIVVHPLHHIPYAANKAKLWKMNLDFYRRLLPYCEQFGIRVAAENMWQVDERRGYIVDSVCSQPEEFAALLDALDSPFIVGCLDLGHSALVGVEPADFIRALGPKRLQALHVHDVNYVRDCHTLPFMEKLDWASICRALADIGYEGDFTLEADNFMGGFPRALLPEASALMAKTGRYLMSRIQSL